MRSERAVGLHVRERRARVPLRHDTVRVRLHRHVDGQLELRTLQSSMHAPASFDRAAVAQALASVNVASCKDKNGPTGPGHVVVTYVPDGTVSRAEVDLSPFAGTTAGDCIANKLRAARVQPFTGGSVKVGKAFILK
jgi:hypothetical protein